MNKVILSKIEKVIQDHNKNHGPGTTVVETGIIIFSDKQQIEFKIKG